MSAEENKALIQRYMAQVDHTKNVQILDDFVSPDFVDHGPLPGTSPDFAGFKDAFEIFRTAIPGDHTVDDLIAEGDKVVARITGRGIHAGTINGIPATGKEIVFSGISIWRIENGKIVEHWNQVDQLGLLVQLGVIPPMG